MMHQGPRTLLKEFAAPHRSETARRMTNLLQPCQDAGIPAEQRESFSCRKGLFIGPVPVLPFGPNRSSFLRGARATPGYQPEYEKPLTLGGCTRYPDFTIEDEISGRNFYWEHLGLLEREDYRRSWEAKLAWYRSNGILPAEEGGGPRGTLLTTTESSYSRIRF